jgi:hypothetical protein
MEVVVIRTGNCHERLAIGRSRFEYAAARAVWHD